MPIKYLLHRIPGGQNVQVFVGTSVLLGICAIPVYLKDDKPGHDLFSQEKPQSVLVSQEKLLKEFDRKNRESRS